MYCLLIHHLSHTFNHSSIKFSKGESLMGAYSLYTGMMCDNGELVVIYEWTLPCKATRRGDTRRIKQVMNYVFISVCLLACLLHSLSFNRLQA